MSTTEAPPPSPKPVSVLFVCLGNICRSPMAEAVFTSLAHSHPLISSIDSCGTGAYHIGSSPDPRTMSTLKAHGIKDYRHSARKFRTRDLETFDWVFAMDSENLEDLREVQRRRRGTKDKGDGEEEKKMAKLVLFGEFGGKGGREEIEDPYYGANDGFEVAYEQCVRFSRSFLERLERGEME